MEGAIYCIGRRWVTVEKGEETINLVIHWKDQILATLPFKKEEVVKLIKELEDANA